MLLSKSKLSFDITMYVHRVRVICSGPVGTFQIPRGRVDLSGNEVTFGTGLAIQSPNEEA